MKRFLKKNDDVLLVYCILVAVLITGVFLNPKIVSGRNIGNVLEQAIALGIVSLGEMLVILLGGIDLSVGAVVSMTTAIMSTPIGDNSVSIILNIIIVLAAGFAIGCFNGLGVVKFKLPPFIMTLASMSIVNGVALKIRPIPGGSVPYTFSKLLNDRIGIFSHSLILWIGLMLLLIYILSNRRFGREIYAVGGNPVTSRLSGINVGKVTFSVHVITSLLAAVGGIYVAARMGTGDPTIGKMYALDAVTVCVLGGVNLFGGRGRMIGLLGSTLVFCLISNLLNLVRVEAFYQYIVKGLILLVMVFVYSMKDRRKNPLEV